MQMNIESRTFGVEVKKKLLDINMQQSELAEKLGISDGYLSEILKDKKEALDVRRKIIAIISTSIESRGVSNGG